MKFVDFMQAKGGRVLRILLGIALIVVGLAEGNYWVLLALVGLVPLTAGVFGFCLLSPVFHTRTKLHGHS